MDVPLKRGDSGLPTQMWQHLLIADGWDLGRWGADGAFGGMTHNATVGVQAARWLPKTGVVDVGTLRSIVAPKVDRPEMIMSLPDIEFVEAKNFTRASGREIKWIVLHSMEAGEASTTAENVARWFAGARAPRASAHFCVDDDSIVQCVRDEDVAWHAPGANRHGIGIEQAGYARQTREQWLDPFSSRMMDLVAVLCARKCLIYDIPVEFVDAEGLKAGRRGITYHREVSEAFERSSHWDPGPNYPIDELLTRIRGQLGNS